MTTNPLAVLPPIVRLWLYALAFLASLAFTAWKAANGDWVEFASGICTAFVTALAGSNVDLSDRK